MKSAQGKKRWLARLMLVAMLFAQGIVSAHACVTPADNAIQALSAARDAGAMPCHQLESANANACLIHCTQSDQVNLDHHAVSAIAVDTVVLQLASPVVLHTLAAASSAPQVLNSGPPLPIRFCTFLL